MRLVIFDCDGTLVDSQHLISAAMTSAFTQNGLAAPPLASVRSVVGLSLAQAMEILEPSADLPMINNLCTAYREAHLAQRTSNENPEPLFHGIEELLTNLANEEDVLLGIATGKSRRGLIGMLEKFDLSNMFVTLQTADDAPSKPHPAMIEQAMAETGTSSDQTVMIGDTSFDMTMAKSAGALALGVSWGYHPIDALQDAGADAIAHTADDLHRLIRKRNSESAS